MTAVLASYWLSGSGGNAISLNRDTDLFHLGAAFFVRLAARGKLKIKSDPAALFPSLLHLEGTRRLRPDRPSP